MTAYLSNQFASVIDPATHQPVGNKMKEAYLEGKDLYAMIAQSAFNNDYTDNLENYAPGTIVEVDGKKAISGKGKEYEVEIDANKISIDWYDLVPTIAGDIQADQLQVGMQVISSEGNKTISAVSTEDNKTTIIF